MFDKILVPVDFSECSAAALRHALALKRKLGAALHVVHSYDVPTLVPPHVLVLMNDLEGTLAEHAERQAKTHLAEFLLTHGADEETRRTSRVLQGPPASAVLETLADGKHDLVVMGTHGRTGLSRLFMGSTAEKLLRAATCPVLTVRVEDPTP